MQNNLTFGQVAVLWKEHKREVVKHSTFCAYALTLKVHLLPTFGNADGISESQAQQFVFDKLRAGLSCKSVHDIVAVMKSVVRFGAKHGIFPAETWDISYPRSTAAKKLPVLSLADHKRLLNTLLAAPTTQNIGVLVALCTGMRMGEVCALRWDHVDFKSRTIIVDGTFGRVYDCETRSTDHYISSPKTRSSNREIPVSSQLLSALRKVRRLQIYGEYVVGNGLAPKDPRNYRETFVRMLRRMGIPRIVFHGLRHTFATRCIESGCDVKTVSAILGHSNVATTLNLYVHPDLGQKKRCIERLGRYMAEASRRLIQDTKI